MKLKTWKNFKSLDRRITLSILSFSVLVILGVCAFILIRSSSTSVAEKSDGQLQTSKHKPAKPETSTQPSTSSENKAQSKEAETPASNTPPSPTPSARQTSPGYSPDHIKTMPPSATATLAGLQVSAVRSGNDCVLTMHASVTATGANASGQVNFKVRPSDADPAAGDTYPSFFTVPKDQTQSVTKSTGPLIQWLYTTSFYVSTSIIGAQGTSVGAPTGITTTTVGCPPS